MIIALFSIVAVSIVIFAAPTVITIVFGMLPTFAAFITDREKGHYATYCVASFNFCGLFPYMLDLWINEHTILAAVNNLTDVFALIVIFGAAGCGWVIYSVVPSVISSFLLVIAQRRVATLRNDQRKLIDEWGDSVAEHVEGAVEKLNALAERARVASVAAAAEAAGKLSPKPGPPSAPGAPTPPGPPSPPSAPPIAPAEASNGTNGNAAPKAETRVEWN
ncbi:MAG: hypothetical protein HN644_09760 [Rhodospirillales bacterium]|nr:hypothetical protein [Rhodospirillales bacterium]MBT7506549.1 hypothetical protein [Rhodospirillales bacterium]